MVILDARSLDLDDSIDHLATTWEVSDDPSFHNVLLQSEEDYKNKLTIIFSENLDPDMKYYARARALTAAGWTSWGNVDVFKVRNNTDLTPQDVFPTKVSIPRIRTFRMVTDTGLGYLDPEDIYGKPSTGDTDKLKEQYVSTRTVTGEDKPEFDNDYVVESLLHEINPEQHDLTLFEIWVDGFEVIGNASLKATSYWIEDTNGDVIWKSLVDRTNRSKIKIQDLILKADKTYRIRAVFHTDSNDVSQIATKTIITQGCNNINLVSYLDQVPFNKDIELQLEWVQGLNLIKWEVLQYSLGIIKSVWKAETTTILSQIPKGVLSSNSNYLLRIKTNLSDCYKYYPFITTIVGDESPNDPLTPLLVYPTTVTVGINNQAKILVESMAKNITYISDSEFYNFNKDSKFITGIKVGESKLYVKAKIDHYRENIIEVNINVAAEDTGGSGNNGKFIKAKPDIVNLEVAEEQISSITTNCDRILIETESDTIRATLDNRMVRILGLKDGNFEILAIGYDITNNAVASAKITGKVTDTGGEIPPDPEPEPEDYYLELEPAELEIKAGESKIVKINTNAPYWDPRISEGDFFTYKKMSSTDLKISSTKTGTGMVVVYASDKNGDIAETVLNIKSIFNVADTEMVFDETSYECKILNNIEIPFTSNITSVDEYEIDIADENIELIRKLESSFILKPKYEAANQSFNIIITAKKNSTETHEYNEASANLTLIVPDIVYEAEEVIVFPNEPDEDYNYLGGVWAEQLYYPPNPLEFRIYTHKEAAENKINFITNPFEDGTGVVISKKLGEVITTENDKFKGLKPLDFMIKTGNNDDLGNPENTNIFKIKPVVNVRGVPYERTITLSPTQKTQLTLSETEIIMDKFGVNSDLQVHTNAKDYTVKTSNSNVAYPTKTKTGGKNIIQIDSGIDGTAIFTFEAVGDSGVLVIETCTIKVGNFESSGEIARPLPGETGFGVSMAPIDLSKKYGLEPVDKENINNPEHHYFGAYKDNINNIMCFIPKMYFYRDTSETVVNKYDDKLHGGPKGKDKWLMRVSYTQEQNYFLHRAFINNGKEIDGIFVDKYLTTYSGSTVEELSIPRSVPTGTNVITPLQNKIVAYKDRKVTLANTNDKAYWVLVPKNRHEAASWNDRFTASLFDDIALAEWGAQIENGTTDTHVWRTHVNKRPYPYLLNGVNNPSYNKMKDPAISSKLISFDTGPASIADASDDINKKITHSGYKSGVTFTHGTAWETLMGLAVLANTPVSVDGEGNKTYTLHTFKLNVDRSNINPDNVEDPALYNKIGITVPKDYTAQYVTTRIAGTGEGYPSVSNQTNINNNGYILGSIGLAEYKEDYEFCNDFAFCEHSEINKTNGLGMFNLRNLQNTRTLTTHAGLYITDSNSANNNYNDMPDNEILLENYDAIRHSRRVIIVPNEGKDLEITEHPDLILPDSKPVDFTKVMPSDGLTIKVRAVSTGPTEYFKFHHKENDPYVAYTLKADLNYLNSKFPRHGIPTDPSKVGILVSSKDGKEYGTIELNKTGDYKLKFTPGKDYRAGSTAEYDIAYAIGVEEVEDTSQTTEATIIEIEMT